MIKYINSLTKNYKGEIVYVISNYTTPLVGLIANVVAASYIDPVIFGSIQSILLIAPYFSFLHLGTFNGLNRNLSFYKVQNEATKVQAMIDASKDVANAVTLIGGIGGIIILVYNLFFSSGNTVIILASIALTSKLIFGPQALHFDTTFRSGQEFNILGKIKFTENIANSITGALPIIIGFWGRIAYDFFKPFFNWVLRYNNRPYKKKGRATIENVKELVITGFPLLLGGYILQLFLIADQSVIAVFLGKEELGYYTISKLILLAIPVIPQSLGVVLYPKASARYGKKKNNQSLNGFFWRSLALNMIVLIPICVLVYFLIEPAVLTFMPEYANGIRAAQINIFTSLTFISYGPSIIIGVVKRNLPVIIANLVSLICIWAIGWFLTSKFNAGIEQIAWARFSIALCLSIFTVGYSYYLTTVDEYNV